jgi:hypothetical protein
MAFGRGVDYRSYLLRGQVGRLRAQISLRGKRKKRCAACKTDLDLPIFGPR